MVAHTSHHSYVGGLQSRPASLGIMQNLIQKITKAKRDRAMAQVVEHLPSKHKAKFKNQYHRERERENIIEVHYIYMYIYIYENNTMKPTKNC
jgi:hypothetical protein